MKIAVNTRLLLKDKLEGIGVFTCETMKRMVKAHPEHTFYFIFDRNYDERFLFEENVKPVLTFPPARHPYLWYIYFEYSIPYVLRKVQPDLFLSPDGWLSLRTDVPQVDVIHDLNFEYKKDFLSSKYQNYYVKYFPQFARKAARIATVSEFSKQDIHRYYGIPEDKIDVVYNSSGGNFAPLAPEQRLEAKVKYAWGCDYFLFVSAIHKRKNLANMLRAFDSFKENADTDMKFVVAGEQFGRQDDVEEALRTMRHAADVRFLGHVTSEELAELMASAHALVYASLFEGFGIPILEAFAAETAVITSNVTSMPEVAGDAAILVDPQSVEQIADAMRQLWADEPFRQSLIAKGREQRTCFSWEQTADKLWQCVEKAMQ